MRAPTCDSERLNFLRELGKAKGIFLKHFEDTFVKTAIRFQSTAPAFSDRQRTVIDEMFKSYGHQL